MPGNRLRDPRTARRSGARQAVLNLVLFAPGAGLLTAGLAGTRWLVAGVGGWLLTLVWSGKLALSAALIVLGAWDLKTGVIPNLGTAPLIALSAACLGTRSGLGLMPPNAGWIVGLGWPLCLLIWKMNIFRGGDMKLCLALLAFFPEIRFVWLLLGVIFAGAVIAMVRQQGIGVGVRRVGAIIFTSFTSGKLPTPEEVEAGYQLPGGSHRFGYLFSLAGLLFLWLF